MESNVTYRQGVDFFESTCQVLAFVCNCTSDRSIGFVRQVAEHFTYVDIFKNRPQKPGTLELWGKNKRNQRYVLGLFAQYSRDDDISQRLGWFKNCLRKITKQLPTLKSIAFPRRNKTSECKCSYIQAIEDWAKTVTHIKIEIIDIESPHERYLTSLSPPAPEPSKEGLTKLSEDTGSGEEYFEKPEYIKIESEVNEWISCHTNMKDIPSNPETCSKLATSLSDLLLKDNPDLHGKIKSIVPVEDDFFSILEQEASNSDLN